MTAELTGEERLPSGETPISWVILPDFLHWLLRSTELVFR
jgi:hypothetical protein